MKQVDHGLRKMILFTIRPFSGLPKDFLVVWFMVEKYMLNQSSKTLIIWAILSYFGGEWQQAWNGSDINRMNVRKRSKRRKFRGMDTNMVSFFEIIEAIISD